MSSESLTRSCFMGGQGLLGAELSRPRDAVLHPHRAFPQLSGCIRQGCNRHNIAVSIPPWPTVPRCWTSHFAHVDRHLGMRMGGLRLIRCPC